MCFPLDWALKGQNDIQPFLVSLIVITVSCTEQVFNQYLMNSFDLLIKIRNRKLLCNLAREEGSSVSPKQPSGKGGFELVSALALPPATRMCLSLGCRFYELW